MTAAPGWLCSLGYALFFFAFGSLHTGIKALPVSMQDSVPAIPFYPMHNENDLDVLIKAIGDSRVVLLGGSTHGTHEFYQCWSAITKKLIEEKGFDIICVEGDWDDSYKVNRFIKGQKQSSAHVIELLKQYDRWPAAMWANYETAALVQWLNGYNQALPGKDKIGFYGLDVYSFWEWTDQKLPLQYNSLQNAVTRVRDSFALYDNDAGKYTEAVRRTNVNYSAITEDLWSAIQKGIEQEPTDEAGFIIQQQALLALEAERYFRTVVTDKVDAWNIRENYMSITIERLLNFYGSNSKAVIWVHNTHAGDAQYSQMAGADSSIGGILKNEMGDNKVFSIGFGTNKGTVLAAYHWNAPLQEIEIPPARKGSWQNILHELSPGDKIILSRELENNKLWNEWIDFRSIGAVYSGKDFYGTTIIPQRFDAFVYIDSTTALRPLTKGY